METNTNTSTTDTRPTFARQYPLAMIALAAHMRAHMLTPPWEISQDGHAITLKLYRGTDPAWLRTLVIDGERSEERAPGGRPSIRTEWQVRLPESGFRFTVVAYRSMPDWSVAS